MKQADSKTQENKPLEPPLTPLIDVVFQLLIFFMLNVKFKEEEGNLASYLPTQKGVVIPQPSDELFEIPIRLIGREDSAEVRIGPTWTAPLIGILQRTSTADRYGRPLRDLQKRAQNREVIKRLVDEIKEGYKRLRRIIPAEKEIPVKLYYKGKMPYEFVMDVISACSLNNMKIEFVFAKEIADVIEDINRRFAPQTLEGQ